MRVAAAALVAALVAALARGGGALTVIAPDVTPAPDRGPGVRTRNGGAGPGLPPVRSPL